MKKAIINYDNVISNDNDFGGSWELNLAINNQQ